MNEELWRKEFSFDDFSPPFPCPHCSSNLQLKKDTLKVLETGYSKEARSGPEWEPDWSIQRFICFLECGNKSCREVVAVSGETGTQEKFIEELNTWGFVPTLLPKSLFPAPPIIAVSKQLSDATSAHLWAAFGLFWSDEASAANRLRVTVESLLDDLHIPKTTINSKRKRVPLSLASRIDKLEAKKSGHKDALDALRWIGNHASHSGMTSTDVLLAGFELFEGVVAELIDKKSAAKAAMAKLLIKSKGRAKASST